jgi:hypothetical protein
MSAFQSSNGKCSGSVTFKENDMVIVEGTSSVNAPSLSFIAAAPADRRASHMGSGLPFASPEMAYEGTPNKGVVPVVKGKFHITLFKPNSYYVKAGAMLVQPHVHITIGNEYFSIPLGYNIPNRSLTGLPDMPNRTSRR